MIPDNDFEDLHRREHEGPSEYPDVVEEVERFPGSVHERVECPTQECEFTGTVTRVFGRNSYYRCPDCGNNSIVVVG